VAAVTAPVAAATTGEGTVTTITRPPNPFNMQAVAAATTPVVAAASVERTAMTTPDGYAGGGCCRYCCGGHG